ncbi:MAG: hypothetical protein U0441_11015 [Polyangiaceae bacterium]
MRCASASRAASVAAAALAIGASGCEDLSRFSTAADESYCGAVTAEAAFRRGFDASAQMRLTLDASKIDGAESPGVLTTREAPAADAEVRLLDAAPLRPIPPLAHDLLSRPALGEGRVRTAIYAVTPADPDAEGLLAALSLRNDGAVEVRLLRAGASDAADAPEGRRPLFGLFTLHRAPGACF